MIKIYHNPRCSKSRETLKILESSGVEFVIVEYLKTPLSRGELLKIMSLLNVAPRNAMRIKETIYKELSLGDATKTEDDLISAIIDNPILLERPIIVTDKGVCICRPPELVRNYI